MLGDKSGNSFASAELRGRNARSPEDPGSAHPRGVNKQAVVGIVDQAGDRHLVDRLKGDRIDSLSFNGARHRRAELGMRDVVVLAAAHAAIFARPGKSEDGSGRACIQADQRIGELCVRPSSAQLGESNNKSGRSRCLPRRLAKLSLVRR